MPVRSAIFVCFSFKIVFKIIVYVAREKTSIEINAVARN